MKKVGGITLIQIKNYKSIDFAEIHVDEKGLITVTGPNGAGKSTICESIKKAIEGVLAGSSGNITEGNNKASITIKTDGGYEVIRNITMKENIESQSLELKIDGIKQKAPSKLLKLLSSTYTEPQVIADFTQNVLFGRLSDIMDLSELNVFDKKILDCETLLSEKSVLLKHLGLKDPVEEPVEDEKEPFDLEFKTSQKNNINSEIHELDAKIANIDNKLSEIEKEKTLTNTHLIRLEESVVNNTAEIDRLEKQLALLRLNVNNTNESIKVKKGELDILSGRVENGNEKKKVRVDEKNVLIDNLHTVESEIADYYSNIESNTLLTEYKKWLKEKTELDEIIKTNRDLVKQYKAEKKTWLSNINFPIPNLRIDEDLNIIVNVHGKECHWDSASESEKAIIAFYLAAYTLPEDGFRYLYYHRGESIGSELRSRLCSLAQDNNITILMEVMNEVMPENIENTIVVKAGKIVIADDNIIKN